LRHHFCRFFFESMKPSLRSSVMLTPPETAKPLNSFLNSGLTLKLSDPFSLSGALPSLLPLVRLLAKAVLLRATTAAPSARTGGTIQISAFLAIQKTGNKEFWIR
jgi:hypothetical protein